MIITNITHKITKYQFYLICSERRLTDAVDYLENAGYTGDTAIFVLAYIQGGLE